MKIHCFVFPECQSMIVMSRVLVICACKSNIFINRARERSIESGSSAYIYIYNIYTYKDANFHRKTDSIVVKRDFDETMNYILCGGLPEYPLQRCEKSWTKRIVIRITISAIILHMLSHNKSTNIDSYHVLTFQK